MAPRGMNTGQAAVIEPILSNHVRGYANAAFIATKLAPVVMIPNRAMRVIKFGKEDFRRLNTRRSPGATTQRVTYGYASDPVSLAQDSLEAVVPFEVMQEANSVPGIDLSKVSVERVMVQFDLGLEISVATRVRNAANYAAGNKLALAGASMWSDAASDPSLTVDNAKEAIRTKIGRYPNIMTIGPKVFNALKRHPKIKEQFKYTSSDSVTAAMLATYFSIAEVVVGEAVYLPDNAADTDAAQDIWGNDAVLAFAGGANDFQSPSFAYTYRLAGNPYVEMPYQDRPSKSWVYPVTNEQQDYLTAADAGFLIQNAA